ncbi:MarR family winged helix-turn-helix transcriptional regulator [Methanobacterium sp.]|uniref:MarR family winged helix-turn-helix transcriptional regulator n=1 Tax=Methanobacterium sp. TaxID=2164 RepID=UPI003C71BA05
MQEKEFQRIVDNILIYYPLFYRKIKTSMSQEKRLKYYNKPLGYYQVLGTLINTGSSLSISEIGKMLYISKPNMTALIDKLVKDGNVNRSRSSEDRRIIKVEITEEGRNFMFHAQKSVEINIKENLSNLDSTEIQILNESLENIRKLFIKIQ